MLYPLIALVITLGFILWQIFNVLAWGFVSGFMPLEMALAKHTPVDVVGNLGGMRVVIPRYYAKFVEYDGDPGFGQRRKGPRPERTPESRLRSFGMDVRFPDMKGLENDELRAQKRRESIHESTWLLVSVVAGEIYPGDGSLDRRFSYIVQPQRHHWSDQYERQINNVYGLEAYLITAIDPSTGRPGYESRNANDVYVDRLPSGRVVVQVDCNRASVPGGEATCLMDFSLEPKASVLVTVGFRRALLPEWRRIHESVQRLILSFEADPQKPGRSP